jgi:hypothetical protein
VRIRAGSSDDVNVVGLEIFIDGVRIASGSQATLKKTWRVKRRMRVGRHRISVVARDAAGNTAKRSMPIRVRR